MYDQKIEKMYRFNWWTVLMFKQMKTRTQFGETINILEALHDILATQKTVPGWGGLRTGAGRGAARGAGLPATEFIKQSKDY